MPKPLMPLALSMALLAVPPIPAAGMAENQPWTTRPNGEGPPPAATLKVPEAEIAAVSQGGHTAALVWHELRDWSSAVAQGARAGSARMGMEIIAETNAGFETVRQKPGIKTVMASDPWITVSLPIDPPTAVAVHVMAGDAGARLVSIEKAVDGSSDGEDYVTVVSAGLFRIGNRSVDARAAAMGKTGTVGYMFHDAAFPVTNQRDNAFRWTIENAHPYTEIVIEPGMTDPANAEDGARVILSPGPDPDGICTSWAEPARGVLSVPWQRGNDGIGSVTMDRKEPVALDMLAGGNTAAIVANEAYGIGVCAAGSVAAGLLGREIGPFLVVDALAIGPDNVLEGWERSLNRNPPATAIQAAKSD